MRKCFVLAGAELEPLLIDLGIKAENDWAIEDVVVGEGVGKLTVEGLKMVSSDLMISSGGSRTAESTMMFVIC